MVITNQANNQIATYTLTNIIKMYGSVQFTATMAGGSYTMSAFNKYGSHEFGSSTLVVESPTPST